MCPLILCSLLFAAAATAEPPPSSEFPAPTEPPLTRFQTPEDVLARFAHEPPIQVVHDWARRATRSGPETISRLLRASRTFAIWPQVKVNYRLKEAWGQEWLYRNALGQTPMPGDELVDLLDQADRDRDHWITMEARWDLQELVMSSEHIRAVNEAQDLVKLRDTVLAEVTRLYFERRRQQVQMLLSPASTVRGQMNDTLRLQELTAAIDALTDGRFSNALSPPGYTQ